jgi:hypothetical protein
LRRPLDLRRDFVIYFEFEGGGVLVASCCFLTFSFPTVPQPAGADGLAMVIRQCAPEDGVSSGGFLGERGCEMGYGGISRSLAIELDCYQTADRTADPDGETLELYHFPCSVLLSSYS